MKATLIKLLPLVAAGLVLLTSSFTVKAQLNVVATTGMIADLVKNIGGEHVKVTALMGTGVDPHLYKATQGDLRRIMRADVILYNGLHLEGKMQDVLEKLARKKAVFAVAEIIPENQRLQHGQYPDPHVWFDLALWRLVGERVTEILVQQDPKNKQSYLEQSANYLAKINRLNDWTKKQIAQIPESQRVLITAHDAFGYFGKAYGIKVMGLQGISTAAEFGLQDIKRLKDVIVQNQVKAVFVETSVSPRFIESLVAGVKAEGHDISVGGELYSDAMGPIGTTTDNYLGMVKSNVNTIVNALK